MTLRAGAHVLASDDNVTHILPGINDGYAPRNAMVLFCSRFVWGYDDEYSDLSENYRIAVFHKK